jgi:peroxiredoxin
VNPFEVLVKDTAGRIKSRRWRDTIVFNPLTPTSIRIRFEDFPGKTVLHCHNLQHEDQGMMMAIQIVGKGATSVHLPVKTPGLSTLPAKVPVWKLVDANKRPMGADDLAGSNHLVVFYRGLGCVHCRRQLQVLAGIQAGLQAAKIKVVTISPDSADDLREGLRSYSLAQSAPFVFLADEALASFKQFGCFDGRALHGIFLVDARGIVRWQFSGDEPFMDAEELLRQSRLLLTDKR